MADHINYSFSYSFTPSPPPKKSQELIAFEHCEEFSLPGNLTLVRGRISGRQTQLTNDLLYALKHCTEFKTLDDHVAAIAQALPSLTGKETEIRAVLAKVRQEGLMVAAEQVVAAWKPASEKHAETQTLVCILTCERPAAVQRLLNSMVKTGVPTEFSYVLIDDSRSLANRNANVETLDTHNKSGAFQVKYFGAEQQSALIGKLQNALPQHRDSIDFLLRQHQGLATYGRSRNFALLLSVGKKLITLDDDLLYQPLRPPTQSSKLSFGSGSKKSRFFSSSGDWASWMPASSNREGLAGAAGFLGMTPSQAIEMAAPRQMLADSLRDARIGDLTLLGKEPQILACCIGSLGDSGTTSSSWLLQLDAESRGSLLASEDFYRQSASTKCHWLGYDNTTLSIEYALLSQALAVDHRILTAPYFPFYRNEDFLFGEMLKGLHPQGLCANLPFALPHLPLEDRPWLKERLTAAPGYGFLGFTGDLLFYVRQKLNASSAEVRLHGLAAALADLGDSDPRRIAELIRNETSTAIAADMARLDGILRSGDNLPAYFVEDIRAAITNCQVALQQPSAEFFPACMKSIAPEHRIEQARQHWRSFSDCLLAWPEIRTAARDCSDCGI